MGKQHEGGGGGHHHHHHHHHHHSSTGTGGAGGGGGGDGTPEIIKTSWMTKRSSQLKSRFSLSNYKERWFVLTRTALVYYDGADVAAAAAAAAAGGRTAGTKRTREKGRVHLKDVRLIERVQLREGESKPHSFQVGYTERQQPCYLYIQAKSGSEREEWLQLLRNLCRHNAHLADKHHPMQWHAGRWLCCGETARFSAGCDAISWTPRQAKLDSTVPPLPASALTGASSSSSPAARKSSAVAGGGGGGGGEEEGENGDGAGEDEEEGAAAAGSKHLALAAQAAALNAKIVIAVYPFTAIEPGDLTLVKGEEYIVLDDSQEHWWQVQNSDSEAGFIPSNYVKEKDALGLQNYDWYVADMSRQRSESLLKSEDKDGCFVVRNSSTKGLYTLSLYTKVPHPQVKHYHIKQNAQGYFYLSEKHCCVTIPELMEYHSYNAGGLACRLKCPPGRSKPATAGLSHGKWEIDPTELTLLEELGSGQFGVVRRGKWKGTIDVAVKMMKEGTMSEDDFIDEAKVMTKLQHVNLVQLYGVCSKNRPIFIITEYMKHGSLLHYLRRQKAILLSDVGSLMDIVVQVCRGMAYLERHNYIHRDLAARNCLVGSENVVKVADFGLARYVIDDQYTSNGGAKFPIKWSPPEVLNYTRFSSKSDVWAFGVLCWEVFTCGEMPYGRAKNPEVVDMVQRGQVLEKPKACPLEVYEAMRLCWAQKPEDRPSLRSLKEKLVVVAQSIQMD